MAEQCFQFGPWHSRLGSIANDAGIDEPLEKLMRRPSHALSTSLETIWARLDLSAEGHIFSPDDVVAEASRIMLQLAQAPQACPTCPGPADAPGCNMRRLAKNLPLGIRVLRYIFNLRTALAVTERNMFLGQRKLLEKMLPDQEERDLLPWYRLEDELESSVGGFLTQLSTAISVSSQVTVADDGGGAGASPPNGVKREGGADAGDGPAKRRRDSSPSGPGPAPSPVKGASPPRAATPDTIITAVEGTPRTPATPIRTR